MRGYVALGGASAVARLSVDVRRAYAARLINRHDLAYTEIHEEIPTWL